MIHDSTSSAYQLLENLLEWARTQTNRVKYNPSNVNVYNVVNDIISLVSLQASNKEIILSNEVPTELVTYADRNMLNTIIRNIASNAVKFTKEGSVTFAGHQSDKGIVIEIADTGIGMSKEQTENLFKVDDISSTSGTSGEQGTGLGLIVCQEFIKINKGSIHVNSEEGKGSRFIINLPAEEGN
jgi:signal transduction histidine kinase